MKIEIGVAYRPLQSAAADALLAGIETRHYGRALIVAGPADAVIPTIAQLLTAHGLEPVVARPNSGERPHPTALKLIVIAGAEPYGLAQARPTHEHELAWLRAADATGTPILGIGHGALALADALGAKSHSILRRPRAQSGIGWNRLKGRSPCHRFWHPFAAIRWPLESEPDSSSQLSWTRSSSPVGGRALAEQAGAQWGGSNLESHPSVPMAGLTSMRK